MTLYFLRSKYFHNLSITGFQIAKIQISKIINAIISYVRSYQMMKIILCKNLIAKKSFTPLVSDVWLIFGRKLCQLKQLRNYSQITNIYHYISLLIILGIAIIICIILCGSYCFQVLLVVMIISRQIVKNKPTQFKKFYKKLQLRQVRILCITLSFYA